jgi:2,5-diketo-D-gluconate reductase A
VTPTVNQIEKHPVHQQVETQRSLATDEVQVELWGPLVESIQLDSSMAFMLG